MNETWVGVITLREKTRMPKETYVPLHFSREELAFGGERPLRKT
jgi:hypothetical protein